VGRRRDSALPADPDQARAYLIDMAEKCFETHGFRRTKMDDIAAEAQVSRPTLYRYFGDRDSLILAIAQRRAGRFAGVMQGFFAGYPTLAEQLLEGLLHLGGIGHRDLFFGALVTADTIGEAHQILMDSPAAIDFARDVWEPVLLAARERGELADTIVFPDVYRWLTSVNILLIGWLTNDSEAAAAHRVMIESFVVPAFLSPTAPR
jgi:AcrR family transcriptional regulator